MRDLYIILSVIGWAWCLPVAAFFWVRHRRLPTSLRDVTEDATVREASEGRPEADV